MKVIIAGSRSFSDYDFLREVCDKYLKELNRDIEIVSGTANGADILGERYAKQKGFPIKKFPANWELGKKAGYLRNKEMAEYADGLIAFHDGTSRGTKHMIDLAKERNLKIRVINF